MDFPGLRDVLICREVGETLPGPLQMHRLANPPGATGVLIISSQPWVIVHHQLVVSVLTRIVSYVFTF